MRKNSEFEAQVYMTCAAYFPRMYGLQRIITLDGPEFEYFFGRLNPFVLRGEYLSAEAFNTNELYEFVRNCLRFTAQCMYSLHILHDCLSIVHGDLKPSNIMYSNIDCTRKIIDFDHAMRIEESLKTLRTAGTPGTIKDLHPFGRSFLGYFPGPFLVRMGLVERIQLLESLL